MAKTSALKIVEEQREFLHDLSSPLMIAMGIVEATQALLTRDGHTAEAERLEKARVAINRMSEMLKANRLKLKTLTEELKAGQ
ncbi:MAG: hypothetical protein IT288_01945 [Bdellovibrionales bacterium]|nr:hypothetical protein [Bdellovibrionales bacterium]